MRVALVTDFYYPWIGGPAALIRSLVAGLAARGHTVFLLAPSPDGKPAEHLDGRVHVSRVPTLPVPFGYQVRMAQPVGHARDWLRRTAPDVIHVHHPFPLSSAAVFAARRLDIPVVATNHTIPACSLWGLRSHEILYRPLHAALAGWITYLLDRCERVVTPTATAATMTRELGFRGSIEVISNGIDIDRFAPGPPSQSLRDRLQLSERPIALYTGRLDAEKQMDVWLRAAAAVLRRIDATFVIGGEGTARTALVQLAADLGISNAVRFPGYLDDRDYPELYRLADVYMMLSPVELQSITTLEAVASGLPIIAADAGALPELVGPDNGALVREGDWLAAADCLANILRDTATRDRMGEQSRRRALAHDVRRSVERYETVLAGSIAARRGANTLVKAGSAGQR